MGTEIFLIAVLLLAGFAIFDLMVGVSNDAVNFLNSAIGSRAAPRRIIMIVATLGIMAGVTFSGGMMEVARKGIFNPGFFNMPQLMIIFLAVMITDVILLDMFNTYGLPTSTTVSIVFELLGAAVAVSVWIIVQSGESMAGLVDYINTAKALTIIGGILLSVVVAFACGALVQALTRMIFTFDIAPRLKYFGAVWGSIALSSLTYFILVKGAKGATFMTSETKQWITGNTFMLLAGIFSISVVILLLMQMLKLNILKPIVMIGTFALAMAFAANDLVNFIGVPMAGYHAYEAAAATETPLTVPMDMLAKKVPTETVLLLIAGAIMAITLWISKKARSVTETEISLGHQDEFEEGGERFDSTRLSRSVVRMVIAVFDVAKIIIPAPILSAVGRRFTPKPVPVVHENQPRPAFDMLRATVNLMVAGAVISYATSYKLPLSTTYVTFMVAMGTSFADRAWGRESAVYRVTGVMTVIGGWFMTAIIASTTAFLFASLMFGGLWFGAIGLGLSVTVLLLLGGVIIWRNHYKHIERTTSSERAKVFNLKKITSIPDAVSTTFEHTSILLQEIRQSLDLALNGLFYQDFSSLGEARIKSHEIQRWSGIITANAFKAMRLLQRADGGFSDRYGQTFRRLEKLADGHRDIIERSYMHVINHHKGLLPDQVDELGQVRDALLAMLENVEHILTNHATGDINEIRARQNDLKELVERLHDLQMERVRDGSSKTRLSILYYAIIGNCLMMGQQNVRLMEIYLDSFGQVEFSEESEPEP